MADNKQRVTDYIADFLASQKVDTVFQVSGGGMMFLLDSIGRKKEISVVCNHHEQASAMSAVTYAKLKEGLGACYLTTGCGATNAITGLLNAWQDNISCFFFSGQSKISQTIANAKVPLRQFGVQEANIIPVVESLSKYAVMLQKPEDIRYQLEKALYYATCGRPGPVWIDVPLDIQGAFIEPDKLRGFNINEEDDRIKINFAQLDKLSKLLKTAQRPVIIAGQGVRLAKAIPQFREFLKKTNIPFVGTYLAVDYVEFEDPSFLGTIGVKGTRAGNFAIQNADLVLVLGSRLSVSCTGYDYDQFAREAKVIVVDIDNKEHQKETVKIDLLINMDLQDFFSNFQGEKYHITKWQNICAKWKHNYPVCLPEYKDSDLVNQYYFVDCLSKYLANDAVVISDAGSAFYVTSQAIKVRGNQRYITSGGQAEMGYTVPATIGAAYANKAIDIIGITGEGSFQMNIQELQTIAHENLPIKLFIWNNGGYLSIKASQDKFFNGFYVGVDEKSGISFPDLGKISAAYKIKFIRINSSKELAEGIKNVLSYQGPVVCEVMCDPKQLVIPTLSSFKNEQGKIMSKPLEDLFPFLDREEFAENMIIPPLPEK